MAASRREGDRSIPRDGSQAFHRRHELVALDAHTVVAGIEDDMHHFELTLHHDGTLVQSVEMQGLIAPALTLRPTLIELRRVLNAVEYSHSTLGDRRLKLLTPTRRYAAVLQFA